MCIRRRFGAATWAPALPSRRSDDGPEGSCPRRSDAGTMAETKRAARRSGQGRGPARVPENAIAVLETEALRGAMFGQDQLADRLKKAVEAVRTSMARVEQLGDYRLTEIDLTCSLKAGFVILDVEGGLTLTYTIPRPAAGAGQDA